MRLRSGGIFNDVSLYTFTAESDGERILKIDQHLAKLWAIKYRVISYETQWSIYSFLNTSTSDFDHSVKSL